MAMNTPEPINPSTRPMARQLLAYIAALPSGHILTGQHTFPNLISHDYDRVFELTGKHPAVWGQDFGFAAEHDQDSIHARQAIVDEAIAQHQRGAIITLMWHAVRPTEDEPGTFRGSVQGPFSASDYADLVTPGTDIHRRWSAQVDVIAGFLKQLQDADVPVLWRPYHEMNGDWFWWGYRSGERFKDLWRQLYHYLTDHHRLDNLIWVWNTNAPDRDPVAAYAELYPGDAYADILATDIYKDQYHPRFHDGLLALAGDKPIAIGECGQMPTPAIVQQQPEWRWFMTWTSLLEEWNSVERIRGIYHAPNAISRDDPRHTWRAWRGF
jgi:mannan endo-1,4-beta-mannosidase